jgi:AcrR family transcriptional regulator
VIRSRSLRELQVKSEETRYRPVSFASHLALEAERATGRRKGERTRRRIRAAAAELLEEQGYHGLRMGDVAQAAGLSQGAIYRYYDNKQKLTVELLTDFAEISLGQMMESAAEGNVYQRRRQATRAYVASFAANTGLMRCIRQLADEIEDFRQIWLEANARWYSFAAEKLLASPGKRSSKDSQKARDVAHALGAMVDELLYEVFVRRAPTLRHYRSDHDGLSDLLSALWYRAAYGENPDDEHPLPRQW